PDALEGRQGLRKERGSAVGELWGELYRDEQPHGPRLGRALESGGLHLVGDEQDHERDRQHEREAGEDQCAQARVTLDGRLDLVNDGAHALAISTSHADRYALAWSLCNDCVSGPGVR